MSLLSLAALALIAQAAEVASADGTIYFEANEQGLQAEESWAIRNMGSVPFPAEKLVLTMGPEVTSVHMEGDGSTGFALADDRRSVRATAPLPPGETRVVTLRYGVKLDGARLRIARTLPFEISRARVILEDRPELSLGSSERVTRSERELNGVRFAIWEMTGVAAGKRLELDMAGLPVRPVWPQGLALLGVAGVLVWAVGAVRRGRPASTRASGAGGAQPVVTPLSGAARRERLVRAVELLDAEHAQGKLDDEQHGRRRRALVGELAVVLRDLALDSRRAS